MKTYACFYKGSAAFAECEASYESDFQRRLEEMNRQSSRNWIEQQVRQVTDKMAVVGDLDHAIEEAFA